MTKREKKNEKNEKKKKENKKSAPYCCPGRFLAGRALFPTQKHNQKHNLKNNLTKQAKPKKKMKPPPEKTKTKTGGNKNGVRTICLALQVSWLDELGTPLQKLF